MNLLELRGQFPQYDDISDGDLIMALREKFYPDMHPRTVFNQIEGAENAHTTISDRFWPAWSEGVKQPMTGEDLAATAKRTGGSMDQPTFTAPTQMETAVRSGFQGMSFGGGDEATAAITSLFPGRDYDTELKRERARLEAGREAFPKTALASEVTGAVAMPGAVTRGGGGLVSGMGQGAAIAGAEGALQGFLSGEGSLEERLDGAWRTALLSGGVGAATRPIADALRAGADNAAIIKSLRRVVANTPGADPASLQAAAQKIFKQVSEEAPIPQSALSDMVERMQGDDAIAALDPLLTPNASRVVDQLTDMATSPTGRPISYRDLQIKRQQLSGLPNTIGNTERAGARAMKGYIDDLVETGFEGGPSVAAANDMWRRLSRNADIEEAIRVGESAASGAENGIRVEFRKLMRNKKTWAGFNDTEKAAVKAVVDGTNWGNLLKKASKAGFGTGAQTNVLGGVGSMGVSGGAATALLGPEAGMIVGAGVPMAGTLAGRGAEAVTRGNAEAVQSLLMSGAKAPENVTRGRFAEALAQVIQNSQRGGAAAAENEPGLVDLITRFR